MVPPRKMALDFDEVFVQSFPLISEICLEKLGVEFPQHVYRYTDWKDAPITEEDFHDIIFRAIPHSEWVARIKLMPGVLEGVHELIRLGFDIHILTSRSFYAGEIEAVELVLEKCNLTLPIVGTAYQPKAGFLDTDVQVVLDDQLKELENMPSHVHRLLFCRSHNEAARQNLPPGIVCVRDWPHGVETIKKLLNL